MQNKTLADLAAEIKVETDGLRRSLRTTVAHAIRIGEILVEAKKLAARGEWTTWKKEHTSFSTATISNYMLLAEHKMAFSDDELETMTVSGMLAMARKPKATTAARGTSRSITQARVREAAARHGIDADKVLAVLGEIGVKIKADAPPAVAA